jgi:uncharacterized alkaline shock family protein YloU
MSGTNIPEYLNNISPIKKKVHSLLPLKINEIKIN